MGKNEKVIGKGKKICKTCGEEKPLSEFYEHRDMTDGHSNFCNGCRSSVSNISYHLKMKKESYKKAQRHRRLERYHRQRKEHYLNLFKKGE